VSGSKRRFILSRAEMLLLQSDRECTKEHSSIDVSLHIFVLTFTDTPLQCLLMSFQYLFPILLVLYK
jgi:hypothetical protein